jgi:hypothetical protein
MSGSWVDSGKLQHTVIRAKVQVFWPTGHCSHCSVGLFPAFSGVQPTGTRSRFGTPPGCSNGLNYLIQLEESKVNVCLWRLCNEHLKMFVLLASVVGFRVASRSCNPSELQYQSIA